MPPRADAHLHFFQPGFVAQHPESCRRVQPDEVTLYTALREAHQIEQCLVVGFEGDTWAAGNNAYLAHQAAKHPWIRPVAFANTPANLAVAALTAWQQQRFVGLSLYRFGEPALAELQQVSDTVWDWLVQHRWLISVNSQGDDWLAWQPILARHPQLRLLISHCGLPPAMTDIPDTIAATAALQSVLALAQFPQVRVKLSGFYALTQPGYNYPHRAAWPYVTALLANFGAERLLWGSDFSPSLEWVSFPQTLGLFALMPFLDAATQQKIEGENLLALLAEVVD
jgi:predicted TIM-barrel fold metal-dependent hydrolase